MSEEFQTLDSVLTDLIMYGADRAALVRPAQAEKPAAVCVIMMSDAALRQLGSKALEIARELGTGPRDFGAPEINEKIGLGPLFDIADAARTGWCWASFSCWKTQITLAVFSREAERVAAFCTALGAPCSLDSQRSAPGWHVEKEIRRG